MERRRRWVVPIGLGLGVVLASAIAVQAADPVTIQWNSATGKRGTIGPPVDWGAMMLGQFQKLHPEITVDHVYSGGDDYAKQLMGGAGPDVIVDCCETGYNSAVNGLFMNLSPFFGNVLPDIPGSGLYDPEQLAAWNVNGKQYAVPQYLGTLAIFANRDIFEAAGVDVPSDQLAQNNLDWNGLEQLCKKLTKLDATGKVTQYGFVKSLSGERMGYWMQAAGAQYYVDGDHSRSALASPEAVEALTFLQRLRNADGCMATDSAVYEGGHAAMYENGPWELSYLLGEGKSNFQNTLFPVPIGPSGKRVTQATIDLIAVSAHTKHPEASLALLNYLAGPDATTIRAKYLGLEPARSDLYFEYVNLMESLNPGTLPVNAHVFTDSGAFAHPQWLYSDMAYAGPLLEKTAADIIDKNLPAKDTWYPVIAAINATLAGEKK